MKLKDVLKAKQPDVFKELAPKKKRTRRRKKRKHKQQEVRIDDRLACELMRHDGYRRNGGAIRQTRWGND